MNDTLQRSNHIPTFSYPNSNDSILEHLRNEIDFKFQSDISELDKAKQILVYAHNLFDHNGDSQPSANDPLTIIREAKQGKAFRCVEYSLLAVGLLWAYGIPARKVGLKTADVETREYGAGHVVIEFWDDNLEKWIMSDVQWGILPKVGDRYLSALELSRTIGTEEHILLESVNDELLSSEETKKYIGWVKEYLYYLDVPMVTYFDNIDLRLQKIVMLVPQGVKPPRKFQNMFTMDAVYTSSTADFYASPK